ncbi:HK97 family phage prohead protease [Megasphaera massiliensis]|uniref:HK97 family phage prohead protease n=2 Tax=Megasphaera massiliensis TaxID=1232428 RepID=UPI0008FF81E0|nr:HK97 family phage prohead protease [Megasphaera massiliensis]DAF84467.1 MAG TPA: prohead serine protease [Caudoviricetes sp.]
MNLKGKIERRTATMTTSNNMQVEGYAAVFGKDAMLFESMDTGWKYMERIAPNAFSGTDMSDVVLNYNHGEVGTILARTSNGTLRLTPDEIGLRVDADIIDTTTGIDVYKLVKRGDLGKMSFAFIVDEETEIRDVENKTYNRIITRIRKLYDVSIVDFPAYESTSVVARSDCGLDIENIEKKLKEEERAPAEQRKRIFILTTF